ncbi:MAG: sensor histidine kinase, partial [Planctomycetaceae bacterium]|nr:sensor histidine kinase [Planctomycetaceae bacterium]
QIQNPNDAFRLGMFLLEAVVLSALMESLHASLRLVESGALEAILKEQVLRRGEERFHHLVQSVEDYAIIILDPNGIITSWNAGAERIKGYQAHEIIGQHFSRFYRPEDIDGERFDRLLEAAARGVPFQEKGQRLRKDGSLFLAEVVIRAIRDEDGNLEGFSKVTRDITERDRLDEELRRSYEQSAQAIEERKILETQFHQAQKMDAIGQLAGGVAHDFNNLLTIISGYSEVMLEELKPNNPMREFVQIICDAGERAASLTRQLLAFSRKSVLEPKVLDLNEVVRETEKLLRRLIGEDISLTAVLDPSTSKVQMDPGQLGQLLINLAVNARDAMPKGGKLTVETRNVELDREYSRLRPDVQPGPYVLLSMTDNGFGMSPAVRVRIFEPFYTTKGIGKGTGLGLAVVLGVVKQSGGHVEVYSEPEIGTTFKIYLPAVNDALSIENIMCPATDGRGSEAILLVEDEQQVRELATFILRSHGYQVLIAENGVEAMKLLENHLSAIDLLVTDVVMPGMGGPELAAAMKPHYPQTKVLYCSGYTDDAVVRHGLLLDNVSFLQKPYTPITLIAKVRQVLDSQTDEAIGQSDAFTTLFQHN